MTDELASLDATSQAELVRSGQLSALELVDAAIARLERHNPAINAVIHPCLERARKRARSLQRQSSYSALASFGGVPMVMKDVGGSEAGEPYHAGMKLLKEAGYRESFDSYFTQKLRAAGFISIGRTNMPELAILPTSEPEAYGPTRNPYDTRFSSGGSSGGSAAAVAAGIVPVAHASDGGGSIRGPASMCGLVGLKPTRARCSFGPATGERWSGLSAEFMVTRSVRDCAALLDILAGAMPGDPYVAPPQHRPYIQEVGAIPGVLRIGVMRVAPRGGAVHAECLAAVDAMAKTLEGLGHHLEEAHPPALDEAEAGIHWFSIVACNIARTLAAWGQKLNRDVTSSDVEPLTWALAEVGRTMAAPQWLGTIEYMHSYGRRLRSFWDADGFDLLLTPVQALTPPELGYISSTPEEPLRAILRAPPYGTFTLPMNLSGQPALALPTHHTPEGLPIGTQLVAGYGREDVLFRVAAQVETARPWQQHRPAIFG
jgi:amidase